ncbi:MAG TPA: HEAT repeat domain-containing protein [Acidobacteriota bacterium]|nr:HEAT repeat domain-containing protein [Acidobacteriota bacterium]
MKTYKRDQTRTRGYALSSLTIRIVLMGAIPLVGLGLFQSGEDQTFQVPEGVVVEKIAGPSLVKYPLFADFDDQGRLYVAAGTGQNISGPEIYPLKLGKIYRLEDTDQDGQFDKSVVFADGLVFPQGVLWHEGAVYVASHPAIWRLEDTSGDGVADKKEVLIGKFGFTGNGCDIHGPFLGPDGWMYWTEGRHGYKIHTKEGEYLEGMASRLWRSRFDGSQIERLAGGGFDNPVEITWTADGDLFGTMDQWEGDAIIHYVLGGVYPQARHPSVGEFAYTGRLLGFATQFSPAFPAALCGFATVQTDHFGPEFKNTLLTTHFNVKRLQQHVLTQEGATFKAENKNFLISTDLDFHPTDVLEDADGSLIVLDMGAWFTYGCPTAGVNPKEEATGWIYRVRRKDAPKVEDPWGASLPMAEMEPRELVNLLGDSRPKVRDRSVAQLVRIGTSAVSDLVATLEKDGQRSPGEALPAEVRRNALWALSRIGTPEAKAAIREALKDKDFGVRYAAVHSVGVERDQDALSTLQQIVVDGEDARLRLKAAEGLALLGRAEAVPSILESLRRGVNDHFLEHALIYALIQIADREATQVALADPNPKVRRAALLALDQMRKGPPPGPAQVASLGQQAATPPPVNYETEIFLDGERVPINSYTHIGDRPLSWREVLSILDTEDPDLLAAGAELINRREGELDIILETVSGWLKSGSLDDSQKRIIAGVMQTFGNNEKVQMLVAESLAASGASPSKLTVLRAIARTPEDQLPQAWLDGLSMALKSGDAQLQKEAVYVIRSHRVSVLDEQLRELAQNSSLPEELRVNAVSVFASRSPELATEHFRLLTDQLQPTVQPLLRIVAAEALGASKLSSEQLSIVADLIGSGSALEVPLLVPAFAGHQDEKVGMALVNALLRSEGADALSTTNLEYALQGFPASVQSAAAPLYQKRAATHQREKGHLVQLFTEMEVTKGDVEAGEKIFYSAEAGCYTCHAIGGKGGTVGPDLANVGRRRGTRRTLEKLIFPDSEVLPGYRSYQVTTRQGQVVTGLIAREDGDRVYIRTKDLGEVRIFKNDVVAVKGSNGSVMPTGFDKILSPREINDLLEFLVAQ